MSCFQGIGHVFPLSTTPDIILTICYKVLRLGWLIRITFQRHSHYFGHNCYHSRGTNCSCKWKRGVHVFKQSQARSQSEQRGQSLTPNPKSCTKYFQVNPGFIYKLKKYYSANQRNYLRSQSYAWAFSRTWSKQHVFPIAHGSSNIAYSVSVRELITWLIFTWGLSSVWRLVTMKNQLVSDRL